MSAMDFEAASDNLGPLLNGSKRSSRHAATAVSVAAAETPTERSMDGHPSKRTLRLTPPNGETEFVQNQTSPPKLGSSANGQKNTPPLLMPVGEIKADHDPLLETENVLQAMLREMRERFQFLNTRVRQLDQMEARKAGSSTGSPVEEQAEGRDGGSPEEEMEGSASASREEDREEEAIMPRRKTRRLNNDDKTPEVLDRGATPSEVPSPNKVEPGGGARPRRTDRKRLGADKSPPSEPSMEELEGNGPDSASDSASKSLECTYCHRRLKSLAALVQHKRTHERKNERLAAQHAPGTDSPDQEAEEDIAEDSQNRAEAEDQAVPLGMEAATTPASAAESDTSNLVCETCGDVFKRQSTLTRHRNSAHAAASVADSRVTRPQRGKRKALPSA